MGGLGLRFPPHPLSTFETKMAAIHSFIHLKAITLTCYYRQNLSLNCPQFSHFSGKGPLFWCTIKCSLPADVLWGSFVTNEPQRTSAGRLDKVMLTERGRPRENSRENKLKPNLWATKGARRLILVNGTLLTV